MTSDALQAEAEIFDTLELTRLSEMSDIGTGTIDALHETAELLCRAYPSTPATVLRDRTKRRLQHVIQLLAAGQPWTSTASWSSSQAGWPSCSDACTTT